MVWRRSPYLLMQVLYITYGLPFPPESGAKLRDYHFLLTLAAHHTVTLVCLCEPSDSLQGVQVLAQHGITVYLFFASRRSPRHLLQHLAARHPLATIDYLLPEMWHAIQQLALQHQPDIVQIEHSFLAPYRQALPESFAGHTILDLHNIGSTQYASISNLTRTAAYPIPTRAAAWLKARLMQNWELAAAARFDRVLTVSPLDAQWLSARIPKLPICIMESGIDTARLQPLPIATAPRLLFVGTLGYLPNSDAARWFCESILLRVRQAIPDVSLDLVGRAPPPDVRALARLPNVRVTGRVADLTPYYQAAQVVVVPLRAGGGVRLKIPEALALGRPVVSTTLGAEGLPFVNGEHLILADEPDAFADSVIQLLHSPAERQRLAAQARQHVVRVLDAAHIGHKLLALYAALAPVAHVI